MVPESCLWLQDSGRVLRGKFLTVEIGNVEGNSTIIFSSYPQKCLPVTSPISSCSPLESLPVFPSTVSSCYPPQSLTVILYSLVLLFSITSTCYPLQPLIVILQNYLLFFSPWYLPVNLYNLFLLFYTSLPEIFHNLLSLSFTISPWYPPQPLSVILHDLLLIFFTKSSQYPLRSLPVFLH